MDALKWQVSTDSEHLILTERNYRPSTIAIRQGGKKKGIIQRLPRSALATSTFEGIKAI